MDKAGKEFDLIFFDLPGTLNSQGVVKTLAAMDYIQSIYEQDNNPPSIIQFGHLQP
ncbi:hypothetical protein FACS189432_02030 [Bacteroidia bacterium]|nr:hypothetical protein FACS189432_02030 [Bacteroidia bacterium]